MAKLHVYLGKEGSGKTTCAALDTMRSALDGSRTLLNSMDMHKGLDQIFEVVLGRKNRKISSNLTLTQTDVSRYSREYLTGREKELKKVFRRRGTHDEPAYDLLQFSPGLDEMSTLMIMQDALLSDTFDDIAIDTLSTHLTIKALTLPGLSLYWIESLLAKRADILARKAHLAHKGMDTGYVLEDPVYTRLQKMQTQYQTLNRKLQDPVAAEFVLVLNKDVMNLEEAVEIREQLAVSGIRLQRIMLNKCLPGSPWPDQVAKAFPDTVIEIISTYGKPITGLSQLEKFSQQIYNYIRA